MESRLNFKRIRDQWTPALTLAVASLLAAFLMMAVAARFFPTFPLDRGAILLLQHLRSPWFVALMVAVTILGLQQLAFLLVVLVAALLWLRRYRIEAGFLLLTLPVDLLTNVFKILVDRSRPIPGLVEVLFPMGGNGFPSGHVTHFVVFYGFLAYLSFVHERPRSLRVSAVVLAVFLSLSVGLSRIYLGAHWPSDVIGGYLLGATALVVLIALYRGVASPARS
ncbi:MAG: phosphatase PAP2 family protein [Chloroflexi bacterium]|nr:phosphatase PAP2 family protein [Chloroflexota bacterium]